MNHQTPYLDVGQLGNTVKVGTCTSRNESFFLLEAKANTFPSQLKLNC